MNKTTLIAQFLCKCFLSSFHFHYFEENTGFQVLKVYSQYMVTKYAELKSKICPSVFLS